MPQVKRAQPSVTAAEWQILTDCGDSTIPYRRRRRRPSSHGRLSFLCAGSSNPCSSEVASTGKDFKFDACRLRCQEMRFNVCAARRSKPCEGSDERSIRKPALPTSVYIQNANLPRTPRCFYPINFSFVTFNYSYIYAGLSIRQPPPCFFVSHYCDIGEA